jgi:hypothetical protein
MLAVLIALNPKNELAALNSSLRIRARIRTGSVCDVTFVCFVDMLVCSNCISFNIRSDVSHVRSFHAYFIGRFKQSYCSCEFVLPIHAWVTCVIELQAFRAGIIAHKHKRAQTQTKNFSLPFFTWTTMLHPSTLLHMLLLGTASGFTSRANTNPYATCTSLQSREHNRKPNSFLHQTMCYRTVKESNMNLSSSAPQMSVEVFRRHFGVRKNFWGDWSIKETRSFYHSLLPMWVKIGGDMSLEGA